MRVSQCFSTETPSNSDETVLDGMIRAGASTGLGLEDVFVLLTAAGFKLDREHVRSIVIPKSRRPSPGALREGRNAAG